MDRDEFDKLSSAVLTQLDLMMDQIGSLLDALEAYRNTRRSHIQREQEDE